MSALISAKHDMCFITTVGNMTKILLQFYFEICERIFKIGQHSAKVMPIYNGMFFRLTVYVCTTLWLITYSVFTKEILSLTAT